MTRLQIAQARLDELEPELEKIVRNYDRVPNVGVSVVSPNARRTAIA